MGQLIRGSPAAEMITIDLTVSLSNLMFLMIEAITENSRRAQQIKQGQGCYPDTKHVS